VAPVVGQTLFGETGEVMVALMILMAVTSTGSAEVIAVTSILVYDIYQVYLKVSHFIDLCHQIQLENIGSRIDMQTHAGGSSTRP